MKQLLTGKQMKQADTWSIKEFGMESLILMERAALCAAQHIMSVQKPGCVFIMCGMGNNGADGLAMARILSQNGWSVRIAAIGQIEKATKEWLYQKALLDKMEILPVQYFYESDDKDEEEYRSALSNLYVPAQVYVDALFGVGLSRKVSGVYRAAIEEWNEHKKKCGAYGVAVDICSGLDAKSGQVLGAYVKADVQITFGYGKVGQFLYPGASLSDQTITCDIGMPNEAVYHVDGFPFNCLEKSDAKDWLGSRCLWGNKGTFGRVVIIAGSSGMAGAAYLSALAAYRTGAGLVDIVTPKCNRLVLQQLLPEAVLHCISEISEISKDEDEEQLAYLRNEVLPKAKAIVIGPGLSTDTLAKKLLDMVLEWNRSQNCPIVIDADALNLLAMRTNIDHAEYLGENVILTPHPGELGRLMNSSAKEAAKNLLYFAEELQKKFGCICVCKDARTVILTQKKRYLNLTGNSGMATGGSGDVLTGVIASLAAQGLSAERAAVLGVWLHGAAGDEAAKEKSPYSMIARDLADGLSKVLIQISRKKV